MKYLSYGAIAFFCLGLIYVSAGTKAQGALNINIFDTYFVVGQNQLYYLLALYLFAQGLIYLVVSLVNKVSFNHILTLLHFGLIFFSILFPGIYFMLNVEEGTVESINRAIYMRSAIHLFGIIAFIANIIITIRKKKSEEGNALDFSE